MENRPFVSIGMPVYNGERYICQSLDSLLTQNYENFELIISDNGSTDRTEEICLAYVAMDRRIRYYRNQNNIGAPKNFNRLFELANGNYFMWAAHDDLWEYTYVSKCVAKLEENPSAVLCCSDIKFINEDGSEKSEWQYENLNTLGMNVQDRVHELISRTGWYAIYGLIKSDILKKTNLFSDSYGSDVILLLELTLLGEIAKVKEPLFYYRVPHKLKTVDDYAIELNPDTPVKGPQKPYSYLAGKLLEVVFKSKLDPGVKRQIKADFIETLTTKNFDLLERILKEQSFSLRSGFSPQEQYGIIKNVIISVLSTETEGKEQETSIEMGNASTSINMLLAEIANLPKDWHTAGALSVDVLEAIVRYVGSRHLVYTVETGSGASTLLLSHLSKEHKVFSYDCGSNGLTVVRSSLLLNQPTVEFIEGPTQITIPKYNFEKRIQLALIDGPHGYPFPDLEYYYIYPHLEENALLIVDDIWIPTIFNLFEFLKEDEMFELIDIVGKTAFFRRTDTPLLNPAGDDWLLQNYNKRRFPVKISQDIPFSQKPKTSKKKALVFFPHNLYPPQTGAHQRCLSLLKGLKELGYEVTLFGSNLMTDNPWQIDSINSLQTEMGIKVKVYQGTQADKQFMIQVIMSNLEVVNWEIYTPPGLCESFRQLFMQLAPDVVVINCALWGRLAIGDEFKSAVRVLETIDLFTLNLQMRHALNQYLITAPFNPAQIDSILVEENFFSKLCLDAIPDEYSFCDQYDYTIAITSQEAQKIREHTHQTRVEHVPMTFAVESLNNTYTGNPLFLVGPNPFNIQGYLYFAKKVLPLVLRQLPEFSLRVVGSICQQLLPVNGIQLLGFIPDLKPLYSESRFAICPLIGGTGQQVKIVEAMAHGIPVIALRNVAESSPIQHSVNGFIANDAQQFAEYTIQLFRDQELCRRLGEAARVTIAENFAQNMLVERLKFLEPGRMQNINTRAEKVSPMIVIDGVFFQLYKTGIARVWRSLLEEWSTTGFAKHIVVLDRAGTFPKISGIRYRTVSFYDYARTDAEREMLQQVCDEEGADLFISTYYTTPLSTPSVFMAYDMIPELMQWDLNHPMWQEKHYAIKHASAHITISDNTARDLVKFFPHISPKSVTVAPCGVKTTFIQASLEEINSFRTKYGISKPYFILVGAGSGYKNSILFFKAFSQLYSRQGFEIVCTGSSSLDAEFRNYTSGSLVHMLQLSDDELRVAYSGAVALVYPSKYEGFGLPVLEAIACSCPVITCPNASIPEVVGEAALYVNDEDVNGLVNALCDIQKPIVRSSLIAMGLEQAKKFSWSKMANMVSSALIDATLLPLKLKETNLVIFPDWSQPEESLYSELEQVIKTLITYSNVNQMTLLVSNDNLSEEDATLMLSSVTMNLLMEEEFDVSEALEISLLGQLAEIQWLALLPRIQARIILRNENKQAITALGVEKVPSCELDSFSNTIRASV